MVFTWEELKAAVENGEITKIYCSKKNVWWTHDMEDLKHCAVRKVLQGYEDKGKIEMTGMLNKMQGIAVTGCDVQGNDVLVVSGEAFKMWFNGQMMADQMLRDCYMLAHHKNCNGITYKLPYTYILHKTMHSQVPELMEYMHPKSIKDN